MTELFPEVVVDVGIIPLLVSCNEVKLTRMLKQPHHVLYIGYHRKVLTGVKSKSS